MDSDAGKALLGSPGERWAGYFLMQHKRQLGGSKFISKIRVFKSEKEGSLPYSCSMLTSQRSLHQSLMTLKEWVSCLGCRGGASMGGILSESMFSALGSN